MSFAIGEEPGKGRYRCVFSEDIVELRTDGDALPGCPNSDCLIAHETRWEKI
jgi:hypothetical protein